MNKLPSPYRPRVLAPILRVPGLDYDVLDELLGYALRWRAGLPLRALRGLRVSAHFLVRRSGDVQQFVPVQSRAWHAGESSWRGRSRCNDFSVGVELEGTDDSNFADAQYRSLASLARRLIALLPIHDIAAHSDIAPQRKSDPGTQFDWLRFVADLARR